MIIFNIIIVALIYTLVSTHVFLSAKIFKFYDLTCEASVMLGGWVFCLLIISNQPFIFAILASLLCGVFVGMCHSYFTSRIKIHPTMASIIILSSVHSIINAGTLSDKKITFPEQIIKALPSIEARFFIIFIIIACVLFALYKLFISEVGLCIRAAGSAKAVAESFGIDAKQMFFLSVCLGNAISAMCGALLVFYGCVYSISMGDGVLIFCFSILIIGDTIINEYYSIKRTFITYMTTAIIYRSFIEILTCRELVGINPELGSMFTSIMLIVFFLLSDNMKKNKEF